MTDSIISNDQDKRVKQLKRDLEGLREIILPINSVLLWEKQWYPGMLAGIISAFFLFLWYMDPSFLTTFSIIGLVIILIDYFGPIISASICHPENWTGVKEKQLEEICRNLAYLRSQTITLCSTFSGMRTSRPRMFYGCAFVSLAILAWIGNTINNLFLTYIFVMGFVALPGLKHHGILEKYCASTSSFIFAKLKNLKDKDKKN